MKAFEHTLTRFLLANFFIVSGVALGFRFLLIGLNPNSTAADLGFALPTGFLFDWAVTIYVFAPIAILLTLLPKTWLTKNRLSRLLWTVLFIEIYFFLFMQICEYFFFAEFTDRYNFIAVDYLVYTHEVVANIMESYSIILPVVLVVVFAVALGLGRILSQWIVAHTPLQPRIGQRLLAQMVIVTAGTLTVLGVSEAQILRAAAPRQELLAKNGIHSLFTAYKNNEIDFQRFYTTMDAAKAKKMVQESFGQDENATENVTETLRRHIHSDKPANNVNVVMVVMESMSARFMGSYGNPENLTPNLDQMAQEGLFYDHLYSTGTRTVRGLEALMLSVPPTPGQSIVRRPNAKNLFNLGSVLKKAGYDTRFIYGGRAMFDNMGPFFSDNGFEVRDQTQFPKEEVPFANAWGIADEYLFHQVIKAGDESFAHKRPFLHVVLTTSNHRPYTYPEGRVTRPSGSGRIGAIEYSDYAIGKFIREARDKAWFDSTIFLFVADHNASVAGGSQILPSDYLIPVIFYAPNLIPANRDHRLASQIDVAPTVLKLLNISYDSKFFGVDLISHRPERAFLATYQNVSYLNAEQMVILSPNRKVEEFSFDGKNTKPVQTQTIKVVTDETSPIAQKAVAFYQTASDLFKSGMMVDAH